VQRAFSVLAKALGVFRRRACEREILDALARHTDKLVVVTDARGRIEWVNPSFERVSGYRADEVLGKTPGHLLAGPDTSADTLALMHGEMRAGRGFSGIEVLNYTKRGEPYWVELEVQPLHNAAGRPRRFIGIQTVITERRAAAQALARAKEEAEEASLAKSRFLSRASHELRTPLNAILGFTQLLLGVPEGTPLDAGHRRQLGIIDSSGRHLLALVEDTLDLARIEAGEMRTELRPINVALACRRAIDNMEAEALRGGIRIVAAFGGAGVWAMADPLRTSQVLLNLLSNALKYNRPHGRVWVTVEERDERVHVTVLDTGAGMTAQQQAGLFQPFNRAGAERTKIPGTGIGLSIARQLALRMGGDLTVVSEPGRGSAFTLTLIASRPAASAASGAAFAPLAVSEGPAMVTASPRPADAARSPPVHRRSSAQGLRGPERASPG
jgi:PAS domain S-box-containing protein